MDEATQGRDAPAPHGAEEVGFVSLARIALETGGRFTERTNDLSHGFERTKLDRACIYSIAFHDRDLKEDQVQPVTIRARRDGLRVVHPTAYLLRSVAARRESLLRAAYFSPETFRNDLVRARIFPIRPDGRESWKGLLAVSFPVSLAGARGQAVQRDFGGVLLRDSKPVHRFGREVRLEPKHGSVTSHPVVTFLEPVDFAPGRHTLVAVVHDSASVLPETAKVELEVPGVPEQDAFLVGPILGTRAGNDLVVRSGTLARATDRHASVEDEIGAWNSFVPLMVQHVEEPTDLVAMTLACLTSRGDAPSRTVVRSFRTAAGNSVGTLNPVRVEPEGDGEIRCQVLIDLLPSGSFRRDGEYVFDASIAPDSASASSRREVRLTVGKPAERAAALATRTSP